MKILIACEFSGTVRDAFIAKGHDAWSCDLLPSDTPGPHLQGDIGLLDLSSWDMMIAHPPCTYITNAGVRHLSSTPSRNGVMAKIHGTERWAEMEKACEFFNFLKTAPIERICIENPIPHGYAKQRIGQYDQLVQPWHFGHTETKGTCFWLKNLPKLVPTNVVGPPPKNLTPEQKRVWHRIHMQSPGPNRWKIRSKTFQGFADAMADQWGQLGALSIDKAA